MKVEKKEGDTPPPIFISHDLNYAKRTYNWLKRWGVLPRPGGLDNQELAWVEDMEQLSKVDDEAYDAWLAFEQQERNSGTAQG